MNEKEHILVLVRAIPEESLKYGHRVCVAGINEKHEWRRLYPFRFIYGKNLINFKKKDIIEVELKAPDNDKRKESRKVVNHAKIGSFTDKQISDRILPLVTSVEKLKVKGVSLGIIRPVIEDVIIAINDTHLYDDQTYLSMTEEFFEKKEKVKLPVELRYVYKCKGEATCKGHKMIVIDWELNELTRNLVRKYDNREVIKQKIRERFLDFMKTRDLYFILGTHFRFSTWMIIGILYPRKEKSGQKSLREF